MSNDGPRQEHGAVLCHGDRADDVRRGLSGPAMGTDRQARAGETARFRREEEAVLLFLDLLKQKRARGYLPRTAASALATLTSAACEFRATKRRAAAADHGTSFASVQITLERSLDLNGKRDLDRELFRIPGWCVVGMLELPSTTSPEPQLLRAQPDEKALKIHGTSAAVICSHIRKNSSG